MQSDRIATATTHSGNRKIGDAAATYSAQVSCPSSCAFYNGGGCYAESGALGNFVTAPLNQNADRLAATAWDVAQAEADAIDALHVKPGQPMRLHGVGDCKTDGTARIVAATGERYMDRGGGPVWTYTHAWRTVRRESWGRVSVLASCETAADVAFARQRGYAPSIVVDEFESTKLYERAVELESAMLTERADKSDSDNAPERAVPTERTMESERAVVAERTDVLERATLCESAIRGERACTVESTAVVERAAMVESTENHERAALRERTVPFERIKILPCPAQTHTDVSCSTCRLCMNDTRLLGAGYAIGFEVHGTALAVKKARLSLADPTNEARKLTSRDFIRSFRERTGGWPTVAEVMLGASVTHGSAWEMLNKMRKESDEPVRLRRRGRLRGPVGVVGAGVPAGVERPTRPAGASRTPPSVA